MAQPEKRLTWFSPSVLSCHGDWQSISCPFLQCYEARNTLGDLNEIPLPLAKQGWHHWHFSSTAGQPCLRTTFSLDASVHLIRLQISLAWEASCLFLVASLALIQHEWLPQRQFNFLRFSLASQVLRRVFSQSIRVWNNFWKMSSGAWSVQIIKVNFL